MESLRMCTGVSFCHIVPCDLFLDYRVWVFVCVLCTSGLLWLAQTLLSSSERELVCIWKQVYEKWLLPDSWKHFQLSGNLLLGPGQSPGTLGFCSCLTAFKERHMVPKYHCFTAKYPSFSSTACRFFMLVSIKKKKESKSKTDGREERFVRLFFSACLMLAVMTFWFSVWEFVKLHHLCAFA